MTPSLPADVFGVRSSRIRSPYSFLPLGPWGRNECVTNEPQRTSARRLHDTSILSNFSLLQPNLASLWGQKHQQAGESPLLDSLTRTILQPHTLSKWIGLHSTVRKPWIQEMLLSVDSCLQGRAPAWFNRFIIYVSTNNQNPIFVSRQAAGTLEITIFALFLTVHSVVSVFIFAWLLAARKYGLQSVF